MPNEITPITDENSNAAKDIPIELLIDYRSKGLTMTEIGKLLNCSHANVSQRLSALNDDLDSLPKYKDNRADIMALKGRQALNSITQEKLQKASPSQAAMVYGVLYDKERLERDQATANVNIMASIHTDITGIDKEIAELEAMGIDPEDE